MKLESDKRFSPTANAIWELLTPLEKKQIKKDYPFAKNRNDLIQKLCRKGASKTALSELTGFSVTSISNITKKRSKRGKREKVPILKIDFNPVLMLLLRDILNEKYSSDFDKIKNYPEDYQDTAKDRFFYIRAYEDYFIKANQVVLGDNYRRKDVAIDFCEANNIALNSFYRWVRSYREAGIEGLLPRYIKAGNKNTGTAVTKKARSKKKMNTSCLK